MAKPKIDHQVMLRKHAIGCFGSYLENVDRFSCPGNYFKGRHGWLNPASHLIVTRTEFVGYAPQEMKHYLGRVAIVSQILPEENALEVLVQAGFEKAPDILGQNSLINTIRPNPLHNPDLRGQIVTPSANIGLETLMAGVPIHSSFDYLLKHIL